MHAQKWLIYIGPIFDKTRPKHPRKFKLPNVLQGPFNILFVAHTFTKKNIAASINLEIKVFEGLRLISR